MNKLEVKEIEQILPHRHPFLLVDYIEDYEPGKFAVGYKCVTFREDFFKGHFPQEPVMPGVLMVEALAQTGAVAILSWKKTKARLHTLAGSRTADSVEKLFRGINFVWKQRSSNAKDRLVSVMQLQVLTAKW